MWLINLFLGMFSPFTERDSSPRRERDDEDEDDEDDEDDEAPGYE